VHPALESWALQQVSVWQTSNNVSYRQQLPTDRPNWRVAYHCPQLHLADDVTIQRLMTRLEMHTITTPLPTSASLRMADRFLKYA